jgi:peptidoglycan glycosyltransferase
MMAAAIANDGVMMEPFIVDSLVSEKDGKEVYKSEPTQISETMSPQSAESVRALMRETVTAGTSRPAFRDFMRKPAYAGIDVGGKTGHLKGTDPKGQCDWFVGYARLGKHRIAMAALTVNEHNWRVKSSYIAHSFIEHWFADPLDRKRLHNHLAE